MMYDEEWDACELLADEVAKGGENTLKYCELCELQRANERDVSGVIGVDLSEVKTKMKK
jgi:hypothetical protein